MPAGVSLPMARASGPSSPTTPPHRVLSRSVAMAFLFLPNRALMMHATLCASVGIYGTAHAYL